ncbi:MAG: hypothetical protein QXQ71_05580, partial [Desulfurococcaceae archaeon]
DQYFFSSIAPHVETDITYLNAPSFSGRFSTYPRTTSDLGSPANFSELQQLDLEAPGPCYTPILHQDTPYRYISYRYIR